MRLVEPKVFLIGETRIIEDELQLYLDHLGISEWNSDAVTDAERLIEIMGRLCYRSFRPGLNPNVVKIRAHNDEYLANILRVRHGSVIEHPMINFIFADVSRVFTHELVRHRVGTAISQESLRFVRLETLKFWVPTCFSEYPDPAKRELLMRRVVEVIEYLEKFQLELAELLELDKMTNFHSKKKFTSAMRRFAPEGLATTIGWSANPRTIRNCIEMRTDPGSEEEIRLGFGKLAKRVIERYGSLFGDYTLEIADGLPWYKTENRKV